MGDYITYKDVEARYPAIMDAYKDSAQVEADMVTYSEEEVNNRLAPAFTTPLPVTTSVKDLMIDLCYVRYLRMKDPELFEKVSKAFDERIERILAGDEYLKDADGDPLAPDRSEDEPYDLNEDYSPTMSMLDPSDPDSHVSTERIDAERDAVN